MKVWFLGNVKLSKQQFAFQERGGDRREGMSKVHFLVAFLAPPSHYKMYSINSSYNIVLLLSSWWPSVPQSVLSGATGLLLSAAKYGILSLFNTNTSFLSSYSYFCL